MNGLMTNKYVLMGLVAVAVAVVSWLVWNRMRREGYENEITIQNNTDVDVTLGSANTSLRTGLPQCLDGNSIIIPKRTAIQLDANQAGFIRFSKKIVWISPTSVTNVTFLNASGKAVPYSPRAVSDGGASCPKQVMTYEFASKGLFDSELSDVQVISIGTKLPSPPSPSNVSLTCKCTTVN